MKTALNNGTLTQTLLYFHLPRAQSPLCLKQNLIKPEWTEYQLEQLVTCTSRCTTCWWPLAAASCRQVLPGNKSQEYSTISSAVSQWILMSSRHTGSPGGKLSQNIHLVANCLKTYKQKYNTGANWKDRRKRIQDKCNMVCNLAWQSTLSPVSLNALKGQCYCCYIIYYAHFVCIWFGY